MFRKFFTRKHWKWENISLVRKLFMANLMIFCSAFGLAAYLNHSLSSEDIQELMVASGRSTVQEFADSHRAKFLGDDDAKRALKNSLERLWEGNRERVSKAHLYDENGKPFVSVGEGIGGIDPGTLKDIDSMAVFDDLREEIVIAVPVIEDLDGVDVIAGYVSFGFYKEPYNAVTDRIFWRNGLILSAAFAVIMAVLLLVLPIMLAPLEELKKAANEFALGNFGYRIQGKFGETEIGIVANAINKMAETLERLFKYVNKAHMSIDDKIASEGRQHELTIIFGDMRGFTSFSEKATPPQVFATLNRYYECMGRLMVKKFGGITDKYIGDGIMLYFGLDRPATSIGNEHVRQALRATIYTQLVTRILAHSIKTQIGSSLQYRFGISTGKCLVGDLGWETLYNLTLLGDVVNLSSRLEAKSPLSGLLVDKFTRLNCEGVDTTEELEVLEILFLDVVEAEPHKLKGKKDPVQCFYVRGFADPIEIQRMQDFLLDEFFADDEFLIRVFLDPDQESENLAQKLSQLKDYIRKEVSENPMLPVKGKAA